MINQIAGVSRVENLNQSGNITRLKEVMNDLIYPIQDLFKDISLTAKEKIVIAQIVLAILVGTFGSSEVQSLVDNPSDISSYANPEASTDRYCVRALYGTTVNVRSGPGISHRILSSISGDEALDIVSKDAEDGWYKIKTDDGSTAYISADYVGVHECEGPINEFESNSHFVQMSRLDFNGISIFNIEATRFAPQVLSRLVDVVRSRSSEYPGARESGRPLAIVFGQEEDMFTLAPDLEKQLQEMSRTDTRFASLTAGGINTQVTVTGDGLLVSPGYGYAGTVYEMAFIQVYDGEESLLQIYPTTAHEVAHALYGEISMHKRLADGTFDYTLNNPSENSEYLARLSIDGPEVCIHYDKEWVEGCTEFALALFGDDNEPDLITYPEGTLEVSVEQ